MTGRLHSSRRGTTPKRPADQHAIPVPLRALNLRPAREPRYSRGLPRANGGSRRLPQYVTRVTKNVNGLGRDDPG